MFLLEAITDPAAPNLAPWWGVPVVAGVFLLLGAVLGFWFNWLLEGRKHKRERHERWDDILLERTSTVTTLVKALILTAGEYHFAYHRDSHNTTAKYAKELYELNKELQRECELLDLVAPPEIRQSTHSIQERILPLIRPREKPPTAEIYNSLQEAADELARQVRQHFGIK